MTTLQHFSQSWRRLVFLLPVLVILLILATGLYNGSLPRPRLPKVVLDDHAGPVPTQQKCEPAAADPSASPNSVPDLIRALWAPVVVPITAPTFMTLAGVEKRLPAPEELVHTRPLGKRVCILDVDTRGLDGDGSIFWDKLPAWDKLGNPSAGYISHYLYSAIHGYSYKFVRAPKYADRAPHWSKVIFTKELLKEYDVVVMLDYDAMFPSPELPLEWLLNYWRIGPDVLVAMAEDPNVDVNLDQHSHKVNLNTGFIIAQAGNNTQRLFKDWAECPSETRYKGCAAWKDKIFHEQAAFSSHVRYDFLDGYSIDTHPQYIRTLPCSEANGIPEVPRLPGLENSDCVGQLVRHYWGRKDLPRREFNHNIMAGLTPLLAKAAYRDSNNVGDFRKMVLDGAEVLDSPHR
ncbi:hypothetical protein MFIFM68171_05543 [Madurella fahalii]|uniref:Nucleotide-diphospho-sugar transferase domain-containing protein n=1 Tax=Madurella fahalii TaxID=1157608 RepID=A0ABQ0GC44_9PEZI